MLYARCHIKLNAVKQTLVINPVNVFHSKNKHAEVKYCWLLHWCNICVIQKTPPPLSNIDPSKMSWLLRLVVVRHYIFCAEICCIYLSYCIYCR